MDVIAVEVLHDHVVHLRFKDGHERTLDLDPYLHPRSDLRPAAYPSRPIRRGPG